MNTSTLKKITTTTMVSALLLSATLTPSVMANATTASKSTSNQVASKRLNKLLTNLKSMSANFKQSTKSGKTNKESLSKNRNYSGSMLVQRPNNLRWEIKSPSDQLIVVNSNKMWVYDKDLEQVTKQNPQNQMGATPALLLSGDATKIAKNFTITQPYAGKNYYKLYPKSKSANLRYMAVSFSNGKPVMIVLNDNLGQLTSIKFSNIRLNPSISSSKFNFVAPKGVDVISQ